MMDLTALRRFRRHWSQRWRRHRRLSLALLLVLTLASAILAGLSGYTAAVGARDLRWSLEQASPADRSLLITGTRYTFRDSLYQDLQDRLGNLLDDRLVIRHATLPADPWLPSGETGLRQAVARLDVYSFDRLPDDLRRSVRLVEGRLPTQANMSQAVGNWPPPMEVVIGLDAARQSGYGVGDRLSASRAYHRLQIVGIVDPLDPHADIWGGDLSAFAVLTGTQELGDEPAEDGIALPLIIASESMRSYLGSPVFPHEVSWRITLDRQRITVGKAAALHSNLINFQTQSATRDATVSTGLVRLLDEALDRLSYVRLAHLLLSAQALLLVLYALAMFNVFLIERAQVELATLSARGATAWQATRPFALQSLILALLAGLLLGPGLAYAALHLWVWCTGRALPIVLSDQAWLLSAAAAGLGWLSLVLPVFLAARRHTRASLPPRARLPQQSVIQQRYLDLYLLAFSGLLYWQLSQSGSFLMRRLGDSPAADPLLLIGPFLLLIAAAMVLLRILPFLLRFLAWLFEGLRGAVLPLGLLRLTRDPLRPSRLVLLVGLTAGLVLFAHLLGSSLPGSQEVLTSAALVQGIGSAFRFNALMLLLFGVAAFVLVSFLAAGGRVRGGDDVGEFGVLRTMGLSAGRWLALLLLEGAIVLLLGLLIGAFLGLGLAAMLVPYLWPSLVAPLAGVDAGPLLVDWPAFAHLYLLLAAVYGAALALLLFGLVRARVRPAPLVKSE